MNLGDIKLLFVEDEKELRDIMLEILSFEVRDITVAKDGEEAYKLYLEKKPDIVLSDINMPKLSGIELARKIREHDRSTKIIMLTAHSEVNFLLEATELHLTKYLIKPVKGSELFETLQHAVDEINNFAIVNKTKLKLDDGYSWDFKEKVLFKAAQEIHLTPKERDILNMIFSNPNITITYDMLMDEVWDNYDNYSIDTIKTMIKNIRKKLPKDIIKNVYGTGFKFKN